MHKFVSYIEGVKHSLNNSNFELKLVIGNTSGNMDSTVGAMCMAYYLTLKTGELWTPVINSLRKDFHIAQELHWHLI